MGQWAVIDIRQFKAWIFDFDFNDLESKKWKERQFTFFLMSEYSTAVVL